MPVPTIDVVSGQITGGPLNPGEPFQWINNTNAQVTLTNCGNFCTADSYTVPAAYGGQPGITYAQIRENPNIDSCAFTDPAWNAPGMPHITNPPMAWRRHREKDVA